MNENSKSTVEEIRARFDREVDRFSNLETGQTATMDAPLALELIAEAAASVTPGARRVLDIGCGAGNYTLNLLQRLPRLDVTLVDLSGPMLERARERVQAAGGGEIATVQQDIREIDLGSERFDVVLASAVLHHLRAEEEWHAVFRKLHRALRPGGSFWIFDLITAGLPALEPILTRRYGEYLAALGGADYRDQVFAYIEREDTPRSLAFQLDVLRAAGFSAVEVLHVNGPFAALGGVK